uniref:LapD/MoxY N-terminal periplasmic domain-containing protein n=1 Tax=Microbulbifer agarilyticus TaxID=260552 RepID=UPI0002557F48|nr:LapD/MoxY N-terminal periplasmic domain-containing protein [Microbulbifer agarilyticus]
MARDIDINRSPVTGSVINPVATGFWHSLAAFISQVVTGLCCLVLVLVAGLAIARDQLHQLQAVQARDSAAMLAVQLGGAMRQHPDPASYTRTLLQGVTQSGAYAEVLFRPADSVQTKQQTPDSIAPVSIRTPTAARGVPGWFQQLMQFQPPRLRAEVRSGWEIAGTVTVRRHPAPALQLLWRLALGLCGTGLLILAVAVYQSRKRRLRVHQYVAGLEAELLQIRELLEARYEAGNPHSLAEKRRQEIGNNRHAVKSRTEA